jgi:hypothetical protein
MFIADKFSETLIPFFQSPLDLQTFLAFDDGMINLFKRDKVKKNSFSSIRSAKLRYSLLPEESLFSRLFDILPYKQIRAQWKKIK